MPSNVPSPDRASSVEEAPLSWCASYTAWAGLELRLRMRGIRAHARGVLACGDPRLSHVS
eukprot:1322225-Pyramimonas_sp.AAC.1